MRHLLPQPVVFQEFRGCKFHEDFIEIAIEEHCILEFRIIMNKFLRWLFHVISASKNFRKLAFANKGKSYLEPFKPIVIEVFDSLS